MIHRGAILVCVLPDLNNESLPRYVTNAATFARQIDADVHLLVSHGGYRALGPLVKGISSLESRIPTTVLHSITSEWCSEVVIKTAKLYSCNLIVVPSGGSTHDSEAEGQFRDELLENTPFPTLILSTQVDLKKNPIASVLVPMSGEIRVSSAIKFGLRIANRIHAPVDLVHVMTKKVQRTSPFEATGDQAHHEYRNLLDKVLAEASPFSGIRDRAKVRTLYHVQGTPSVEILKAAKNISSCILVIEWNGSLIHGKAETLKNIISQSESPILLVRLEADQNSILKIGPEERVA